MKKSLIIILLIFILSATVYGADRVDMIVLLDNSVSVLPYYDDIQNSLLKKIISEHLEPGDTFSLITFADTPEVEISREIRNKGDIDEILAYSTILQPMGNYTDLVLALRFLYKYTLDLPLSNRKKIVILTDGIHDPPENSPYYFDTPEDVRTAAEDASEDIHREGWDVSIVELENGAEQDSGTEDSVSLDVMDTVSETIGSKPNAFNSDEPDMAGVALGISLVSIPNHLGDVTDDVTVPLSIQSRSNEPVLFSLSAVLCEGSDLLLEKTSVKLEPGEKAKLNIKLSVPEEEKPGEQSKNISLKLVGGVNTEPKSLTLNYNLVERGVFNRGVNFIFDWRVIAVVAAIIAAAVIIILIKRASAGRSQGIYMKEDGEIIKPLKIGEAKEEDEQKKNKTTGADDVSVVSAKRSDSTGTHEPEEYLVASMSSLSEDEIPHKKNRPVQMLVYGQNTKLGISNVKWLGLNRKRSVGSSSSSIFRIFFIRVPSVIAHIECTGDDFIFTPEKAEYFPELKEPLHNCLNKKIKIINQDDRMFYIEFRQWVSELERLNRLLSMTRNTGQPDLEF